MTALIEDRGLTEKKWRRRSLWVLLVLVPLTLAVQAYDSVKALLGDNDLFERRVAWGRARISAAASGS
ncbi:MULTISPECIES: hypothetical protein [unclassified Mesorhizobium]|uniref:hypothetical protein n=1 Tax=unclassified Mesorhizobium TaxID=325217 RepID=UPI0004052C98|nr:MULTISPECIES: hypothetical protein [unclassified Mesorhizobium]WJI75448.1 hypothetical protein NLY37_01560 [Mesorhizobium sp. C395A]